MSALSRQSVPGENLGLECRKCLFENEKLCIRNNEINQILKRAASGLLLVFGGLPSVTHAGNLVLKHYELSVFPSGKACRNVD